MTFYFKVKSKIILTLPKKVFKIGKKWKSIFHLLKKKGSFKDPLFYLAAASIVLFLVICFAPGNQRNQGEIVKDFQLLKAQVFSPLLENTTEGLFINQTDVSNIESPELTTIQSSCLKGVSPPLVVSSKTLATLVGTNIEQENIREIIEYIVQQGETLSGIAEKFNISLSTIFWANDLSSSSLIHSGQKLTILPISGIMHLVEGRDTLSEIAEKYSVKTEEIIEFNELPDKGKIFVGDLLIIPNGKMPVIRYQPQYAPLAASYFICPIPGPCRVTYNLHPYNAIDFSNGKCAEPIYAAAGGQVQKTGYSSLAGLNVRILHPNGVVTFYGHLSKSLVGAGAKVYQGQVIGYTGYSGYTIPAGPAGCHLHFEVRVARNPFAQ